MSPILLICILCLFAYFVKGVTGAASAIVFNGGLLLALVLGVNGGLTLRDGLYWLAIADFLTSAVMIIAMWRQIRLERHTLLLLAGMVPATIAFGLLLPILELRWLTVVLSFAVIGGAAYLVFRPDLPPASPRALGYMALPSGTLAGALTGLFGMGGPVTFLYLSRASDDPGLFRSRSVLITNVSGFVLLVTLGGAGVYEVKHLTWLAIALPVIVTGLLAGMWCHRWTKPKPFRIALAVLVTIAGLSGLLHFVLS